MSDSNDPYRPPGSSAESRESTPVRPENALEPAGRGSRFLASALDTIVNIMVLFPAMQYMGLFEREAGLREQITVFLLGFLCIILVHGYLLHTRGQSIGKAIVGIQIVSFDGGIFPLSRVVFRRYLPIQLVAMVPVVGSVFALLDTVWIFREDRRCIHDHIAGTMVVNYAPDNCRKTP